MRVFRKYAVRKHLTRRSGLKDCGDRTHDIPTATIDFVRLQDETTTEFESKPSGSEVVQLVPKVACTMGWLQGLRYQNNKQLLESLSAPRAIAIKEPQAEVSHHEYVQAGDEEENSIRQCDKPRLSLGKLREKAIRVGRQFQNEDVPDHELPYIPTEEVTSKRAGEKVQSDEQSISENENLWIVIDTVVYDCSDFVADHPGGQQVIRSFVGEDCSWQFWRFHGQSEMIQHGRPLRIGRTADVPNRFSEIPRYVGLSKNGDDEW